MKGVVLRWKSAEDTSALAGADQVAVHWGRTENPKVTSCTAGLKRQVWCTSGGGCEPVSRETAASRRRTILVLIRPADVTSTLVGSIPARGNGMLRPPPGGRYRPVRSRAMSTTRGSRARSDAKNRSRRAPGCMRRVSVFGAEPCSRWLDSFTRIVNASASASEHEDDGGDSTAES